jgi:two-component system NtrC family sensor kinase
MDRGELEPLLAAAIPASRDAVIVIDEAGHVLEFNPAAESTFGYSRDEALGRRIAALIVPEHLRAAHERGLAAYVAGGPAKVIGKRIEIEAMRRDGSLFPIELTVAETDLGDRRVFTATLSDLSVQAQQQELELTRQRLELAMAGANLGIWSFDPQAGIVALSERSRAIYDIPLDAPITTELLRSRVHPDDWERISAPYFRGFPEEPVENEYRVIHRNGEQRWIYALGAAACAENCVTYEVNGIHIDITERKRAEEELAKSRDALNQSEKLASLGALLAGVSHELNNPLAAIVGQAEMLEEDARGTEFEARAKRIRSAAERSARIVQTFLAMARRREPQRGLVDMNALIASALELTEYALRTAGVAVRVIFGTNLPPVDGERDQLHQVLVNLVVNAQQAMEKGEAFEKVLTVRASLSQAGRVLVDIVDTGPGVPPEHGNRIFEPFFSTKKQGSGTGIGLSYSLGIVEAHGGLLTLEPSRGGAHFRIDLPAAHGAAIIVTPQEDAPPAEMLSGRRRVLLVEDEEDVAETLRELIEREGFQVTLAANGTEAFFALDKADFDILFSDLRMPLLNGRELYERLCEIRPELVENMAFVTGDTVGDSMDEFLKGCGRPILEKPFTRAGIRAVLAAFPVIAGR